MVAITKNTISDYVMLITEYSHFYTKTECDSQFLIKATLKKPLELNNATNTNAQLQSKMAITQKIMNNSSIPDDSMALFVYFRWLSISNDTKTNTNRIAVN